tara:strand:+ start:337 stop:678 length:342 start_codon:yes stop_codon:yes gene_type:complete
MNLINTLIIWSWLLGISLMIPTTLPAGGAKKVIVEQRENNNKASPLISLGAFNLLSNVSEKSAILTNVSSGTPVKVLKVWESPKSGTWLLVSVLSQSSYQFFYKRGWVKIGSS